MLKDNCGCGECNFKELITNGCPKPLRHKFVYLDYNTLTRNERGTLLLKLKEDADIIDEAYFSVVHQFNDWMKNNVSVEDYREILSRIPGTMKNNVPLLKDRWKEIRAAADHPDCSALLSDYHTWFNCSVLKIVLQRAKTITTNDPTEVLSILRSYTEKMLEYSKRSIFECPSPSDMSSTKGTTYCIFKMIDHQLPEEKQFTVNEIELLTTNIMVQFNIEEYVLLLRTFTEGCVELMYSIPLCMYAELFPLSEDQCRYLTTLGLSEITTKDYYYKLEHVSNILHVCMY